MLTETGRVVAVEDDGLWVETLKQSVCSQCAARHGCGQKLLAQVSPASNMTFIKAVFNDRTQKQMWAVGDQAVLGIDKNALVLAALIAYGLPLLGLILGMLACVNLGLSGLPEVDAALGALLGLVIGAVAVKQHARITANMPYFQAQVIDRSIKTIHT